MVTGANCGLGLETARVLAAHGATVVLMSRSVKNGEQAVEGIKSAQPDSRVSTMVRERLYLDDCKQPQFPVLESSALIITHSSVPP